MSKFTFKYVTVLKIVSLIITLIGFTLHAVGFSAKKWDGIYIKLYFHQWDAYQNLWMSFDADKQELTQYSGTAFFGRFDSSLPEWKLRIIYLETTGLAFAFISSILLFVASFVSRACEKRRIQVALCIMSIFASVTAACESIVGVKLYLEQYLKIIGVNGKHMIKWEKIHNHHDIYNLTWAPYFCVGAGGMYGLVAILLSIDLFMTRVKSGHLNLSIDPLGIYGQSPNKIRPSVKYGNSSTTGYPLDNGGELAFI